MAEKEPKRKQLNPRMCACIRIVAGVPLIPAMSWTSGGYGVLERLP